MTDAQPVGPRWRVAVTHDDIDGSVRAALAAAGFTAVPCPVMHQGPPPDRNQLEAAARDLERYDWVICSSVRSVRALSIARGTDWPQQPRTAAVGAITAQAMVAAGAREPVRAEMFTAQALWEKLQPMDRWRDRRVLVTTVAGGRRDLIDGLIAAAANVTEIEAYTMVGREAADIRKDWEEARPDAVILGSAATAAHLIDAVGIDAIRRLRSIVPIGPTTAAVLGARGITAAPPAQATFAAVIDRLVSLRDQARPDDARATVDPSEAG